MGGVMFRIHEILDAKRSAKKKRFPPTGAELFEERSDERTMPFFSIVTEQVYADERLRHLDAYQQGLFWVFVIHALWRSSGRCIRHAGAIAKKMKVTIAVWEELESKLLESGILQLSQDGIYLVQPELRAQYLMTLQTCNNKRRM